MDEMKTEHPALVLMVADDPAWLERAKAGLEASGRFAVVTTLSPEEGTELARWTEFGAVIAVHRPNGPDVITLLRSVREMSPHLPLIIFAPAADEGLRAAAAQLDAELCLADGKDERAQLAALSDRTGRSIAMAREKEPHRQRSQRVLWMAENSKLLTVIFDKDYHLVYVSPSIKGISGYAPEEIAKNRERLDIRPRNLEKILRSMDWKNMAGSSMGITIQMTRRDGEMVKLDSILEPMFREGELTGYRVEGRDISDRSNWEETAHINERRLMTAERVGKVGSWEIDLLRDSGTIWASEGALRIFGIRQPSGTFPLVRIEDCIPEREMTHAAGNDLASKGKRYDLEYEIHPEDGSPARFVHSVAELELDENGRAARILGALQDVTERRTAEDSLRESERHYRLLAENIKDVVWIIDAETLHFRYVSPSVFRLRGFTPEEVLARPVSAAVVDYDTAERLYQLIDERSKRLLNGADPGIFYTDEVEQPCKDGTTIWIEVISNYYVNEETGKVELRGISREITERRLAKEALATVNKKLNILSSITRHDLLNKLTALSGYLELERREASPEKREELDQKIQSIMSTMRKQISFTKDYEDMGAQAPKWQSLKAATDEAAGHLDLSGVKLEVHTNGLEVLADPLFGKVIYNLMDNSLKHGGGVKNVRIWHSSRGNREIIYYEDDGKGVANEEKAHIFQRGYGKNSGLGLFLTREILGITGIDITETGRPGFGVRFELSVPRSCCRIPQHDGDRASSAPVVLDG